MEVIATSMRLFIVGITIFTIGQLAAQPNTFNQSLIVETLSFRGSDLKQDDRVDLYIAVPYTSLMFSELDNRFAAQYTVVIKIRDSIGRSVADSTITRSVVEDSYNITQGSTGKTDVVALRYSFKPGSYRREISVKDKFSHRDYSSNDTLLVPDLSTDLAISSLMYVSQIEQHGTRFSITPYLGNIVWNGEQSMFTFFEAYSDEPQLNVAFSWNISTSDGRLIGSGVGEPLVLKNRVTQTFLPLSRMERALPGSYTLNVFMHPVANNVTDTTVRLAQQKRAYIIPKSMTGSVLLDLQKAIKQLAYVAEQNEIDQITQATNMADQQALFEEFWKRKDPSPTTLRNEAFEEYYSRIETANKRFKSYTEGWLTDMGMVYIIFGEPSNIERFTSQSGTSTTVRWTYSGGNIYQFEDTSGFGDYRLRTPLAYGTKYKYR